MVALVSRSGWSHDHQLRGALVVVVAVVWSPTVAPMVASVVGAPDRLPPVAPLGTVAGQVAHATNRPLGMPPRAPLRKRGLLAARFRVERALSIGDLPALPVLNRLLDRPIPGATTLDRGRPFPEVTRPSRPLQLNRAGLGAGAPLVLTHHRVIFGHQVRVGLPVGLVLLLGLAGGAFAVGGTVGLLPGDPVRRLRRLGLLTRTAEVATAQEPRRAMLQAGEQVAGLLPPRGRLGKPLLGLLSLGGRCQTAPRPVAQVI